MSTTPWWGWLVIIFAVWLVTVATTVIVWVFRTIQEARHGIRRGSHPPADRWYWSARRSKDD